MVMRNDMISTEEGDRYKCPFYGFSWFNKIQVFMENSGSNSCGLKMLMMKSYCPCQMEISEETPNWGECGFNNSKNAGLLEAISSNTGVYFAEGKSMKFREWYEKIMGGRR